MEKILLTGASGFLGSVISKQLASYDIISLGRCAESLIRCDLSNDIPDLPVIDIVIHAAGKAHSIPNTEIEVKDFYKVNVDGTKHLLAGLDKSFGLPKSFVFISSVAVYGVQSGNLISEGSKLSANDPYGFSKIEAEKIILEWCLKNNVICTILRLPIIVGPNPPGNLGAMINGIKKGYYANISGGTAKKSMVLASDVASIIAKVVSIGGVYNLTDGYHPSFSELSMNIAGQLGKNKPRDIPYFFANILAFFGDLYGEGAPINTVKLKKVMSNLTFDDSKAKKNLGWTPTSVLIGFKIK